MGKAPGGPSETHGLRRTNEDKRRAVMTLLNDPEWLTWTDVSIAKACYVSSNFVGDMRRIINPINDSRVRIVERNGKTYEQNTANIGKVKPESGAMVYRAGTLKVIQATDTGNPVTLTEKLNYGKSRNTQSGVPKKRDFHNLWAWAQF